jgi:CRP/FNR family cyclic AMP-dependent transcriptional regulator
MDFCCGRKRFFMNTPYGLKIVDSCRTCDVKINHLFCNLPEAAVNDLEKISNFAAYPKGSILFVEGQIANGVYVICQGKAKLTTSSAGGKTFIMRIAEPGHVLGLSSVVSGRPYDAGVEIMEPSQVNHFFRPDFLRFVAKHGEVALRVAQLLSNNYHQACEDIRSLSLSVNAEEKLARLMLDWANNNSEKQDKKSGKPIKIKMNMTHEEIAQLIGSSRETVTRMMSKFKRKKLIEIHGVTLTLRDPAALARMVDSN